MYDEFRIEIDMEQKMCGNCKKSDSEYYELELQLRLRYYDNIIEMKEKILNLILNNFSSINKIDEIDNGFNIYFRSHGVMNKTVSLFNKYLYVEKRSKKLVGRDQLISKDTYRYFQSLTLVNLQNRDKVRIKGMDYFIKAINKGGKLVLLDCNNGSKKVLTYSIIEDYFELLEKNSKTQ